jgi:hypothetical protein
MGYVDPHGQQCSSKSVKQKRAALFYDNNHDLLLVAKTWPQLLPEVIVSSYCTLLLVYC